MGVSRGFGLASRSAAVDTNAMTEALFTQFAALLAAALLIPSFVFLAYGVNHRNMPFWWTAAYAYLLIFAGAALAAMRGPLPDMFVGFVANAVIGFGYCLSLRAVRMMKGVWTYRYFDNTLTVLYLGCLVFLIIFLNTYQARVGLISTFIALISTTAVFVTFSTPVKMSSLGDIALAVFGIGNAGFALLRGSSALLDSQSTFLSFALWDQVFFVWSISAVFCFAIGLFLNGTALISAKTHKQLDIERSLHQSLSEALEGQRNLKKLILHELKRPLNTLSVSIDMSRKKSQGMSPHEVEQLHQLASAANAYLRGISDYEDIHAVFESPNIEAVPLDRLAQDVKSKWRIPVSMPAHSDAALVKADLLLFDVAIGNLIENAQKYGKGRVELAVEVNQSNHSAEFNVVDDGAGIPSSEAQNVFQQFYKIDAAQSNAVMGCGLGLYVARRVAEALGGTCAVKSQQPSTVSLTLPAMIGVGDRNAK